MLRFFFAVLVLVPLAGGCGEELARAQETSGKPSAAAPSGAGFKYHLTVKVETLSPLPTRRASTEKPQAMSRLDRASERTTYTYEVDYGGKRQHLWTLTRHESYVKHWIGNSGNVFVATKSGPTAKGIERVWLRDSEARLIGEFASHQVRSALVVTDPKKGTLASLKFGEQLRLPTSKGGELRLTWPYVVEQEAPLIARALRSGERDRFTELLNKRNVGNPHFKRTEGLPFAYWQMSGEQAWVEQKVATLQNSWFVESESDERPPKYWTETPGGWKLLFDIDRFANNSQGAARLRILNRAGQDVQLIDLAKLTGVPPHEVPFHLNYRDLRKPYRGGSVPMESGSEISYGAPEQIEMRDGKGSTYVLTLEPGKQARIETFHGALAAARPKEQSYPNAKVVSERFVYSSNRKFKVRLRNIVEKQFDAWLTTLIMSAPQPDGRMLEVELWSDFGYHPYGQVRVTDSGRTFATQFAKIKNGETNQTITLSVLRIWEPDGKQLGGIDLASKDWLGSAVDPSTGLDLSQMTTETDGPEGQIEIDGVPVPVWPIEKIRMPLKDGRVKEMYITKNQYTGQMSIIRYGRPRE